MERGKARKMSGLFYADLLMQLLGWIQICTPSVSEKACLLVYGGRDKTGRGILLGKASSGDGDGTGKQAEHPCAEGVITVKLKYVIYDLRRSNTCFVLIYCNIQTLVRSVPTLKFELSFMPLLSSLLFGST